MNAYIVHNTTLKVDEELWYEENADVCTILPLKKFLNERQTYG